VKPTPAFRALFTLLLAGGLLALWAGVQQGYSIRLNPGYTPHVFLRSPNLADALSYPPPAPPKADTVLRQLLAEQRKQKTDSTKTKVKRDTLNIQASIRLENPDDEGHYALDDFFSALEQVEHPQVADTVPLVRIAHYGDSQIEGDRTSVFLRWNFQRKFGGRGVGYLPVFEPANHHSVKTTHSENWKRNTIFFDKRKTGDYGISGVVFRYPPADKGKATQAFVGMEVDTKRTRYDRLQLWWGGPAAVDFELGLSVADSLVWEDTLRTDGAFHTTTIPLAANSEKFELWFTGPSPDVYGVALDGKRGVQLDNFPLRGHSGGGLLTMDEAYLREQVDKLNTRLIILQYGGNIVPYDNEDFTFYEEALLRVLLRMKRVAPHASILVVGVGDMARKVGEGYESYPSVPKIRDAQKRAAKRAKCAFWDLYRAMGGEGSIIAWANNDPPLAASDYAHLDYPGQRLIGDLLFKAMMHEYGLYLNRLEAERAADVTPRPQ